jgi:NADH-quinone oxidoreductase subunit E
MLGMLKAMRTTLSHLPKKKITVQYPEQRERLPERSRGLFRVVIDPASGDPRCRACTLCESNCPVQVIRVNYASKYQLPVPNAARVAERRIAAQAGVDLKALQPVLDDYYEHGTGLIAILQNAQSVYGYLPRLAIQEISLQTGVSLSQIYGVASFYNQFRLSPVGENIIDVCHGTACHVAGAVQITEALEEELGVADGKTTRDMKFTLSSVACMGACSQAPVMRIGDKTYGGLTPDKTRKIIRDLMLEVGAEKG